MSKFVINPLALLAAPLLATAILAAPAMAQPAEQAGGQLKVEVKDHKGKTLYCVTQQVTGSIMPQKTCRTRAQWIEAGATFRTTAKLALNETEANKRD
ncbi:hypothetical protein [Sphingobium nicotianae]|uniref:Uncharacterized protein n=1 Tax=Sphingobium nicotianae TaxID=2782607 RepID=A0A9X1DBF2_9SPHN|nr:hypothetical protein [Sphingobium nicotianae]MBT2186947.1 hypothetical protein [Sphingobium nicotianae]